MPRASQNGFRAIDLDFLGSTTDKRYEAVIALLREGKISIRDCAVLTAVVERGIAIRDAAEFRDRLRQLVAARVAQLDALRALAPARKQTIDVGPGSGGAH